MLKIVPATAEVYDRILDEGLLKIFRQAGALVTNPGCSGCAVGQSGIIGENEYGSDPKGADLDTTERLM